MCYNYFTEEMKLVDHCAFVRGRGLTVIVFLQTEKEKKERK